MFLSNRIATSVLRLGLVLSSSVMISCGGSSSSSAEMLSGDPPPAEMSESFAITYVRFPNPEVHSIAYSGDVKDEVFGKLQRLGTKTSWVWESGNNVEGPLVGQGEIIYREANGSETTVFSCIPITTSYIDPDGRPNGTEICTPFGPSVSLDGNTIYFAVAYGQADNIRLIDSFNENRDLYLKDNTNPKEYMVVIGRGAVDRVCIRSWDVPTKSLNAVGDWPCSTGVFTFEPLELPSGKVIYGSSQGNVYSHNVKGYRGNKPFIHALQPWIANKDGSNARLLMAEEGDRVMSFAQLKDGRIAYASQGKRGLIPFRKTNGGPGKNTTLANVFWTNAIQADGDLQHSLGGIHQVGGSKDGNFNGTPLNSMRGGGVRNNPTFDWCSNLYYRGNNMGGGNIICFTPLDPLAEGPAPDAVSQAGAQFFPPSAYLVSTWGESGDQTGAIGKYFPGERPHKIKDPVGIPGSDQLLLTYLRGGCNNEGAGTNKFTDGAQAHLLSTVGCDMGIYITQQIPLTPKTSGCDAGTLKERQACKRRLTVIVDEDDWHEFDAQVVAPYSAIYGSPPGTTTMETTGSKACRMTSGPVNSAHAEILNVQHYLHPGDDLYELGGNKSYEIGLQGNALSGGTVIDHNRFIDSIAGIRFIKVLPTTTAQKHYWGTNHGKHEEILGDVTLEADDSFRVELPCETPFVMHGIDSEGHTITADQMPMALRASDIAGTGEGEERTCMGGCHVHSKAPTLDKTEVDGWTNIQVLKDTGPVKVMVGGLIVTESEANRRVSWVDDIQPLLVANCATGCHTADGTAAVLPIDLPGPATDNPKNFPCGNPADTSYTIWVFDQWQNCNGKLSAWNGGMGVNKPYWSKYIASFARDSTLFWYANNARMDGKSNSDSAVDQDYTVETLGGNHFGPLLTAAELRLLARWIDMGVIYDYAEVAN